MSTKVIQISCLEDEGYEDDERSTDGSDDGASLEDFIVKSDDEEEERSEDESEFRGMKEESIKKDLEGISTENIVTGKRKRKQTQFFETEVFSSAEYKKMMMEDVSEEDLKQIEEEEDGEEDDEEEGEDGEWVGEEDDEEEGEEDDEDEREEEEEHEGGEDKGEVPRSSSVCQ